MDGGTFQVGLMVRYFIASLSSGVARSPGLPTTIFVRQIGLPFWVTDNVWSGIFTITYALPRSRGSQRHRSRFAISVLVTSERGRAASVLSCLFEFSITGGGVAPLSSLARCPCNALKWGC